MKDREQVLMNASEKVLRNWPSYRLMIQSLLKDVIDRSRSHVANMQFVSPNELRDIVAILRGIDLELLSSGYTSQWEVTVTKNYGLVVSYELNTVDDWDIVVPSRPE